MNYTGQAQLAAVPEPCQDARTIAMSEAREVVIRKVSNGFIVAIGCKTFVAKSWEEICVGVGEYWKDPAAAQKKYCAEGN